MKEWIMDLGEIISLRIGTGFIFPIKASILSILSEQGIGGNTTNAVAYGEP